MEVDVQRKNSLDGLRAGSLLVGELNGSGHLG
jgi:hypothetical protein